ncbi:hypothetical protein PPERSA_11344 [Pseudocohnilembus persalinus]|uniref:Uncharacterized protein n=1 Tax=Pseudocohnilembus persalinus TaxID=266149 RepID=A0A0V0QPY3_PSEPJ|nr:hypothetical protein PPERSA_11344 [Pseudocohnilembus persalinus]|eukprot:KRX04220.1 hypothetical protein PPERSA_11344 [Pseudocohnilembus persalinus]
MSSLICNDTYKNCIIDVNDNELNQDVYNFPQFSNKKEPPIDNIDNISTEKKKYLNNPYRKLFDKKNVQMFQDEDIYKNVNLENMILEYKNKIQQQEAEYEENQINEQDTPCNEEVMSTISKIQNNQKFGFYELIEGLNEQYQQSYSIQHFKKYFRSFKCIENQSHIDDNYSEGLKKNLNTEFSKEDSLNFQNLDQYSNQINNQYNNLINIEDSNSTLICV